MRRLLPILLAIALFVPATAMAKGKKAAKAKGNVPEWAVESEKCSGDRDVKSVSLGREKVYLNDALNSASFAADEGHTFKHDLYYTCLKCDSHKRTPGACGSCGGSLAASFKHGEIWYGLDRDANGNVIVIGAPPPSDVMAPAYEKPAKKAKKAKKGKGKKAKKAKTEAPAADKKEAAPVDEKK